MIGKIYSFGAFKQIICSWKYIISTVIMAFFVVLVDYLIISDVYSLIFGIIAGVLVYALSLFILRDNEFISLISKIIKRNK